MALTKVLITVKTYPSLSRKYEELVCTAGFREDGSWIRIYPVPFRKLDIEKQYRKWEWIELDLDKRTEDFRPESFRLHDIDEDISILGHIDTKNAWKARKEIALKNVCYNMSELIDAAYDPARRTSLAVLKPKEIIDFVVEDDERDWDKEKYAAVMAKQQELNLFEDTQRIFKIAKKLPYKFSYRFTTEDGKIRKLMIEDWEIGVLYWNMMTKYQDEKVACEKVKQKYFDDFAKTKDLYLFVGTSWQFHSMKSADPFLVIGTFTPPIVSPEEPTLF